jgi:hypothetical protein
MEFPSNVVLRKRRTIPSLEHAARYAPSKMLPKHLGKRCLDVDHAIASFRLHGNFALLVYASPNVNLPVVQIEIGDV